jgi:stearoyl-CoA desaturase (delta-9 desaturase)
VIGQPAARPNSSAAAADHDNGMTQLTAPSPASSSSDLSLDVPPSIADAPMSRSQRVGLMVAVLLPLIGLGAAIGFLWGRGITWLELILFVAMYVITAGGITIGYHRLFTHSSFETPRFIRAIFAIAGRWRCRGRC